MKDLMEKRLASMVDRPWARQLWAMKPAFSSARQIASSPSFQFQLGMLSRWAFITRQADRRGQETEMVRISERVTFWEMLICLLLLSLDENIVKNLRFRE